MDESHRPQADPEITKEGIVNPNGFINVLGAIVTVALVTTVVSNPSSAQVIRAFGDAFSGSLRAAQGK